MGPRHDDIEGWWGRLEALGVNLRKGITDLGVWKCFLVPAPHDIPGERGGIWPAFHTDIFADEVPSAQRILRDGPGPGTARGRGPARLLRFP